MAVFIKFEKNDLLFMIILILYLHIRTVIIFFIKNTRQFWQKDNRWKLYRDSVSNLARNQREEVQNFILFKR